MLRIYTLLIALTYVAPAMASTVGACKFDVASFSFRGSATEQASCLLRSVQQWGKVAPEPATLPAVLADRVGKPFDASLSRVAKHLSDAGKHGAPWTLDTPVSTARDGTPGAPHARYFVIHDTSSPWLGDTQFPPDLDESDSINRLSSFASANAVAHAFVNRRGEILVGHDFSIPWRATKFEANVVGLPVKGLFLHVEFVQPRRRDPSGGPRNDAVAPVPGFSIPQYEQMALLYVVASARARTWLIPAFHAAIDEGLSGAHDDPQHFEIGKFEAALNRLLQEIR